MRHFLRNRALSLLGYFKKITNGIHILNSHYISKENIPKEVFFELLNSLSKQADFIKIEEAVKAIKEKTHKNQKLIAFTFDDGFEECYTKIAPVLKEFKTNAAFFINPAFIDADEEYKNYFLNEMVHTPHKNPMTWEMIKSLHEQGFIIGNHTYNHFKLVSLDGDELNRQIILSKQYIEQKLNAPCQYFAWTYGGLKDIDNAALTLALQSHQYVFSSDNYTRYFSYNNKVLNRRHIEGNWPLSHVVYFLSKPKTYQ